MNSLIIDKKNEIPESFKKYGDLLCSEFKFEKIMALLENKRTEFYKPIGIDLHRIKCQ